MVVNSTENILGPLYIFYMVDSAGDLLLFSRGLELVLKKSYGSLKLTCWSKTLRKVWRTDEMMSDQFKFFFVVNPQVLFISQALRILYM